MRERLSCRLSSLFANWIPILKWYSTTYELPLFYSRVCISNAASRHDWWWFDIYILYQGFPARKPGDLMHKFRSWREEPWYNDSWALAIVKIYHNKLLGLFCICCKKEPLKCDSGGGLRRNTTWLAAICVNWWVASLLCMMTTESHRSCLFLAKPIAFISVRFQFRKSIQLWRITTNWRRRPPVMTSAHRVIFIIIEFWLT